MWQQYLERMLGFRVLFNKYYHFWLIIDFSSVSLLIISYVCLDMINTIFFYYVIIARTKYPTLFW